MSIFNRIFSSDKALDVADNIFKSGIKGMDVLNYTKEEQAENALKAADTKVKLLEAYEPFKLAQRLLALLLVGTFCIDVLIASIFSILTMWYPDRAMVVVDLIKTIVVSTLVTPVSIVVGFYFFGGLKGMIKRK
jgi:hypothetical protein